MRRSHFTVVSRLVAAACFGGMTAGATAQQDPSAGKPSVAASRIAAAASRPASPASRPAMMARPKSTVDPLAVPPRPPAINPASGSRWSCPGTVYDFGEVWQNASVVYRFEVKNTGKDDLQIIDVRTECHCTVAGQFERIVKPGQSGFVPFTLHTAGLGRYLVKHAYITMNDPTSPQLAVELHGTVKVLFRVEPNDLGSFGEVVDPAVEIVREGNVISEIDTPFKFELMPVQGKPPYKIDVKETEPGKKWHVTVRTVPPMPPGYVQHYFQFRTTDPHLPFWPFFVTAFRPERIAAKPINVLMPNVVTTANPFVVEVVNHGKDPVKILSAEVKDEPKIRTEIKPNGKGYFINMYPPMGYQLPEAKKLQIKTDDKALPLIEVTLYKIVERPNLPPIQQAKPQPAKPGTAVKPGTPIKPGTPVKPAGPAAAKAPPPGKADAKTPSKPAEKPAPGK